jgi:hypothetical protein
VKLVVLEYILAGSMHKTLVSPSTTKKITAVNPMAKAIGSPIIISDINTPKMAAVIMLFRSQTPLNDLIDYKKTFKEQAGELKKFYTRLFFLWCRDPISFSHPQQIS